MELPKVKRFSCVECGTPLEVYPPDDAHPTASLERPKEGDVSGTIIKMTKDCDNPDCRHPTTLYWYRQKPTFVAVG